MERANRAFFNGLREFLVRQRLSPEEKQGDAMVRIILTRTGPAIALGDGCIRPYFHDLRTWKLVSGLLCLAAMPTASCQTNNPTTPFLVHALPFVTQGGQRTNLAEVHAGRRFMVDQSNTPGETSSQQAVSGSEETEPDPASLGQARARAPLDFTVHLSQRERRQLVALVTPPARSGRKGALGDLFKHPTAGTLLEMINPFAPDPGGGVGAGLPAWDVPSFSRPAPWGHPDAGSLAPQGCTLFSTGD